MSEKLKVYTQGNESAKLSCMLLHGFGADAHDLRGLSSEIDTKTDMQFLFPQAPYEMRIAGQFYGTAWFPRSEDEVMEAFTGDFFADLQDKDPAALKQSADEVLEYIEDNGIDWSNLIIGGFSQGGMVGVEAALRAPKPPAAVVLMSAGLIAQKRWNQYIQQLPERWGKDCRIPLFQSHGTMDPVLSITGGEALYEVLSETLFEGELYTFYGGHEISRDTLNELVEFIDNLAGSPC